MSFDAFVITLPSQILFKSIDFPIIFPDCLVTLLRFEVSFFLALLYHTAQSCVITISMTDENDQNDQNPKLYFKKKSDQKK